MPIPRRLKQQMRLRNLTPTKVEHLAKKKKIKFHRQVLENWAAGRADPTLKQLQIVAKILGCEVRDFI